MMKLLSTLSNHEDDTADDPPNSQSEPEPEPVSLREAKNSLNVLTSFLEQNNTEDQIDYAWAIQQHLDNISATIV